MNYSDKLFVSIQYIIIFSAVVDFFELATFQ